MKPRSLTIELPQATARYKIVTGTGMIGRSGSWARACIGKGVRKLVIVSNDTVYGLYGKQAHHSLTQAGFEVSVFLMKDGERYKTLKIAAKALEHFAEAGITRTDGVVALGGGVVGDLAGFAASIYVRGVRYLQMPTTLLAMIDSSVGGKTAVNTATGKNLSGTFYQPSGVLIDVATLSTLPRRELTAGYCEAVKQGAIAGRYLFDQTAAIVSETAPSEKQFIDLIAEQIKFKSQIVTADERETSSRKDAGSRKILNFGHTLGHALEKVTDYKRLKHGEAVGYGILFAAELSKSLALCGEKDVKLLNDVLHRVGALPSLAGIDPKEVFEAFRFDKKQLYGDLQLVLIKGIGKPVIISNRDIPRSTIQTALRDFLQKWA